MNGIDEEEWAFVQIMTNPVLFREFINLDKITDPEDSWTGLEEHERAWSSSTATHLAMCCGRGVHKSTTMIELCFFWMVNEMYVPGDPGLLVYVPNKAQKDALFPKFRAAAETHWMIRRWANPNSINVQEGQIRFNNGFTFILRIAGSSGTEANVISLHCARIWVDEAQDFPWRAWRSLGNVLKWDIPWHMLWVSGVPNGVREENVLYECDQVDPEYVSWVIPQTAMSFWTPELELKRRHEYHAEIEDTEDYKHYVLGQHGVPTFTVFDRSRFAKEDYKIEKIVISQNMFDGTKRVDPDGVERYHINEVVMCPPLPTAYGTKPKVGIGYDPGYSPDPAVFFIMWQDPATGRWRNLVRYVFQRVEYGLQRMALAWLDTVYEFDFMGIDMGGVGKVQYQDLAGELSEYPDRKYMQRLYPVEFGGMIVVAATEDEKGEITEKKDLVKRVAVETLSRWAHEHRYAFANEDDDLMSELERTKATRTITGELVYKTENDHQMAAMMCAIMAYENKFGPPVVVGKPDIKLKLVTAHWFTGMV